MRQLNLTHAEQEAIVADVRRERPEIDRRVAKMLEALEGLSDVGQKHALELCVSAWIHATFEDKADALDFSEHLRSQIDLYVCMSKDRAAALARQASDDA